MISRKSFLPAAAAALFLAPAIAMTEANQQVEINLE